MDSKASLLLLVLLFASSYFKSAVSQHCDVVVTSRSSLREDLLDIQNSTCLDTCNGVITNLLDAQLGERLDEVLGVLEKIKQTQQNHTRALDRLHPAASCAEILRNDPTSPSGYYWIDSKHPTRQYCDMTRSCGGVTGGWMRVAQLDMADNGQQCPTGLRQRTDSGKRTCGINSDHAACSSVTFPVDTLGYSKVCGKIKAFQFGSPDSFGLSGRTSNSDINGNYVDGVSLTVGYPRRHVWTFAGALDEIGTYPHFNCPCTNSAQAGHAAHPPAFVGNDYFCDTASVGHFQFRFYSDDPLWDGAGCGPHNTCCSFNRPPWFFKQLPFTTTDDVEMRVCRDQKGSDEDIAIEKIDIYVQ